MRLPPPKQSAWPDPLELLDLHDAIIASENYVILNGKMFSIYYQGDNMFYLSPTEGFVPCGWFDRRTCFAEIE